MLCHTISVRSAVSLPFPECTHERVSYGSSRASMLHRSSHITHSVTLMSTDGATKDCAPPLSHSLMDWPECTVRAPSNMCDLKVTAAPPPPPGVHGPGNGEWRRLSPPPPVLRPGSNKYDYRSEVSILGPVGYEPTTLPLRYFDVD